MKAKFEKLCPHLDERSRRLMAAGEAVQIDRGGINQVGTPEKVIKSNQAKEYMV